jgi:hypothetical protein
MTRLKHTLGLELDRLWLLVILAGFAFYVSLVPQAPNDFWWHLKIGEIIFQQRTIPHTNMFAWSLPASAPFTYGAWLAELLFYLLYRLGDISLIICVRTVLAVLAFGLIGVEAQRQAGSWRLAALALAFLALMSLNNLIVRPQIWSWLPFVLFYLFLSRFAEGQLDRRWLLLLPLVQIFWVNVHGAFVLGPILLGMFLVGEGLRTLFRGARARPWRDVGWLALILALSLATTVINPQWVGIYGYVVNMMTDRPSQGLVIEWQSPTPQGIANTMFFVSVVVLLLILAYARYRPTPTETLVLVGFLWLAFSGQRYVIWYGMTAMPLLVKALAQLVPRRFLHAPAIKNLLNTALVLLLWVPVIVVQPWFVEAMPLPEAYWEMVWRETDVAPLQGVETPIAATAYLRRHPGGQLFNEMGYGSYLIWALPEQGVFVDPRVELYPYEQWLDYIRIGRGVRYNELLSEYGANRILLDVARQKELAALLPDDPLWELEYEDDYAQVWRRK